MPHFAYTVIDAAGAKRRGVRDAPSLTALTTAFEREGAFVLDAAERYRRAALPSFAARRARADLLDVTRSLSTLLPAGLPLARALDATTRLSSGTTAATLESVRALVERGESLADAMSAYPTLFPAHYAGLVRAGERSGSLDAAFVRLAEQLERDAQIANRLLTALLYPTVLALAGTGAVLVLILIVLPNFAALLADSASPLPRSTAIMVGIGTTLRRFWMGIPLAVIGAAVALRAARRSPEGRAAIAMFIDSIPLVRTVRREMFAARFARLAGTLLAGGAPLLSALQDTAAALNDTFTRAAADRVRAAVRDGAALHEAVLAEPIFPPALGQLIALGEESGRLDEFLLKAAHLFEERSDRMVQRLVALTEPAMIVVFGGIVGMVALALLQAIYSVNAGSFR